MKLLTRTNRYYLGLSAVLFVLGAALLYVGRQHALAHEVDEQLQQQRTYLTERIRVTGILPTSLLPQDLTIDGPTRSAGLRDTIIFDPVEREDVPFREVSFSVVVQGQPHWLTLRKSLLETEDMLTVVLGGCSR